MEADLGLSHKAATPSLINRVTPRQHSNALSPYLPQELLEDASVELEAAQEPSAWAVQRPHPVKPAPEQPTSGQLLLRHPFRIRSSRVQLPPTPPPIHLPMPPPVWRPTSLDVSHQVWQRSAGSVSRPAVRPYSAIVQAVAPPTHASRSSGQSNASAPPFWSLSAASHPRGISSQHNYGTSRAAQSAKSATTRLSLECATAQTDASLASREDPFLTALERVKAFFSASDAQTSDDESTKEWAREQKARLNQTLRKAQEAARTPIEFTDVRVQDRYQVPKLPCVFLHGLFGFAKLRPMMSLPQLTVDYWRGVVEVLEENGVEVLVTNVRTSASIEERARDAAEMIEKKFPGREVNLLVSRVDRASRNCLVVQSVLTRPIYARRVIQWEA